MKLGIVGLPNVGKSTLFNAITNAGAESANYPFCTIDPNVGGMSRHLSRLRSKPGYYAFKKRYRQVLESSQTGQKLYSVSHDVKTALKKSLLPGSTLFENMGFTYMGPVDGHDEKALETTLRWAKDLHRPVVVHVVTVKGKGYAPSEQNPG